VNIAPARKVGGRVCRCCKPAESQRGIGGRSRCDRPG